MDYIPIIKPYLGKEESDLLMETIHDNWITGGKKVDEFERQISLVVDSRYAIACSNGTMALFIALKSMGIKEGDEVIVPDFTFIASANAVILAGGVPVFCDINKQTFNIDINSAKKVLTHKAKAIMPVHIYGQTADMDSVLSFALDNSLMVIEDAAQGIGVTYKGHPVGSIGDVGTLSFYADKCITTGEGGMVITNNPEIADNALMLKHQGRRNRGIYLHESIGYNFRITDMQAAIGLAQLSKLKYIIQMKKDVESRYRDSFKNSYGITLPLRDMIGFNVPFRCNILVRKPHELMEYLKTKNIGSTRFFYPLHRQECYAYMKLKDKEFTNSIWAYEHGLSLPSFTSITNSQVDYVCEVVKYFESTEIR
jgi:perosamine synthetase